MTEDIIQEEPESKTLKKDSLVTIRLVGSHDGKSIAQWFDASGRVRRSLVNNSDVRLGDEPGTGIVDEQKLKRRPYGDDLASLIAGLPDADAVVSRLNQVGIWTFEDVVRHQSEALGAFRATFNDAYQGLVINAKKESAQ